MWWPTINQSATCLDIFREMFYPRYQKVPIYLYPRHPEFAKVTLPCPKCPRAAIALSVRNNTVGLTASSASARSGTSDDEFNEPSHGNAITSKNCMKLKRNPQKMKKIKLRMIKRVVLSYYCYQ